MTVGVRSTLPRLLTAARALWQIAPPPLGGVAAMQYCHFGCGIPKQWRKLTILSGFSPETAQAADVMGKDGAGVLAAKHLQVAPAFSDAHFALQDTAAKRAKRSTGKGAATSRHALG